MADKLTVSDLANLSNETSAVNTINNNFADVETAFDNTLSRDGTSPNEMEADLDMNSNRLLNLPEPGSATEPLRLQDGSSAYFIASSSTSRTITNTGSMTFTIESGKAFSVGTYIVISSASDPSNLHMVGIVTDYTNTTLTVDLKRAEGSGTYADWVISITGKSGFEGVDGADGNTVLYGSVDPTTEGVDGDFYINTVSNTIFGPKASGTWPAGTSLVGPAGDVTAAGVATLTNKTINLASNTLTGTAAEFDTACSDDDFLYASDVGVTVDTAGTDNSTDVTLAGSLDYLTIAGQAITRNAIDLTTDVTGNLPLTNLAAIDDSDVAAAASATNYTPSASTVEGHLAGIDTALAGAGGGTATTFQIFTTANDGVGAYTKPAGLVRAKVTVVGGGGSGGGIGTVASTTDAAGGGGGYGGVAIKIIEAASIGTNEDVTCGAGGVGPSGTTIGNPGSSSNFGAHCSATGGSGGSTLGSSTSNNRLSEGGSPGVGSGGDINASGGTGGAGMVTTFRSAIGGNGGSGPFGGGGAGEKINTSTSPSGTNGAAGVGFGSGGAGASGGGSTQAARTGGDGAPGIVIVEEYYD